MSAVHHGTALGSCWGYSGEQTCTPTAHDRAAGRCMPGSLETTLMPTLQPFCLGGGGGGGKAKAVLYCPEKWAIIFLKQTNLCYGVIRCLTGLQEMGSFGMGTLF